MNRDMRRVDQKTALAIQEGTGKIKAFPDVGGQGGPLELVAHFDTRGFLGTEDIDTQFPQIELKADIKTDASAAQIDELKARLATRCPVSAILRKSGTEVIETWNITGS